MKNQIIENLDMDLMKINTRYVLTETPYLVSPAGFAPSSQVYMKTKFAIQTDNPEDYNLNILKLYVHDMQKLNG